MTTRIVEVMRTIQKQIADRSLPIGAKLPSIRKMAAGMKISPSTVVEAYERLVAEGLIRSRRGSGYFVAEQILPLALSEIGPKTDREIDPLWVSRQALDARETDLRPGCGWLPPSWLPLASIRKALRSLSREDSLTLAEYGSPLGLDLLRQLISRRLAEQCVVASPDQIMLTESGTQSIDLICRFLVEPGDSVIVDDPCYFNFQALLRAHRVKIVGVPYTPTGPDILAFAQTIAEHNPRLYITNSAVHNPTGATLNPVTAHRVLKLAEEHDLIIVEDDIFAGFENEQVPRLAAFDGLQRVVQIGSFSKTLSAAARCGFIAARPDWMDDLVDLKIATTFGGARLTAELVLTVLRDGTYRRYLENLRPRLADARSSAAARLKSMGVLPWLEPKAGMFLWCTLPEGLDSSHVARKALARNIVLAPGNVFSTSQSAARYLRFNVTQCDERVFDGLANAIREAAT